MGRGGGERTKTVQMQIFIILLMSGFSGWVLLIFMPSKQPFSVEEDKAISYLYDELNIKKWSLVAKKLSEDYHFERNAKQCRDRYRQVLDPLCSTEWTQQQETTLYQLHNTVGNKWALIATYFPGKTDNYVKNHFYSKLRKAIRYLNRIIRSQFRRLFKQIKIGTVYKIIQGYEEQFKEKPIVSSEVSLQCAHIKNSLIEFANESEELVDAGHTEILNYCNERILIEKIIEFNKSYRKKSKKQKRDSLQLEELFKPSRRIDLILPAERNDEEDSEFEKVSEGEESEEEDDIPLRRSRQPQPIEQQHQELRKSPPIYVIYKQDNLRDSPGSVKSGIDIRVSDVRSSCKIQQQQRLDQQPQPNLGGSCRAINSYSFGFMRGESSFTSYNRTHSLKSEQEKTELSGNRHEIGTSGQMRMESMQDERDESLFRSQR